MKVDWDPYARQRPKHMTNNRACWEKLSAAIVGKAIEDYRFGNPKRRQEVERFIRSEYFKEISNIDPEWLIKNMRDYLIPKSIDHV